MGNEKANTLRFVFEFFPPVFPHSPFPFAYTLLQAAKSNTKKAYIFPGERIGAYPIAWGFAEKDIADQPLRLSAILAYLYCPFYQMRLLQPG